VKRAVDWFLRDRTTGAIVIGQFPNWSLWIWIAATLVRIVLRPTGTVGDVVSWVGTLALLWWAGDEIVRGVNPWRRILGTVVAGTVVWGLLAGR
jgi:hypothetical protein